MFVRAYQENLEIIQLNQLILPAATADTGLREVSLREGCRAECSATTNLVQSCGWFDNGNRVLTNTVYFILRTVATMALACCFIMLDAQTIQMCKMEEAAGKKGSLHSRLRQHYHPHHHDRQHHPHHYQDLMASKLSIRLSPKRSSLPWSAWSWTKSPR